mgnify:FL=1
MLFIRHGIEEYLDGVDACMPTPTKEKRDAMEYALNTKMDVFTEEEKTFFNNDIEKFLVEGISFSKTISNRMYEMIKCTPLYNREGHCYEEFIVPTVAKYFSEKVKDYPGIISYWDLSIEDLKLILSGEINKFSSFFTDSQNIDQVYLVHKVDYGYNNPVRKLIREIT